MAFTLSTALRTARASATNTEIGAGAKIDIYTGSKPATVATAATGTKLGTLTGGSPFGTVSNGVLTANAITQDSSADATGTAGWFRIFKSDGVTAVLDGTCSANGGGGDMQMPSTAITAGNPIVANSCVLTEAGDT